MGGNETGGEEWCERVSPGAVSASVMKKEKRGKQVDNSLRLSLEEWTGAFCGTERCSCALYQNAENPHYIVP